MDRRRTRAIRLSAFLLEKSYACGCALLTEFPNCSFRVLFDQADRLDWELVEIYAGARDTGTDMKSRNSRG